MTINSFTALLFAAVLTLQGCGSGTESHKPASASAPAPQSIVDVAIASGKFTTLIAALEATGLDTTLSDMDSKFTVFAPTDDAFALLGQEVIDLFWLTQIP